ncbi:MAG: NIPSNAP family protein [Chitinophagaceae bacterium]|nr:NIPSNAP family protein [Chitinophagaceae bacterium]
MKFRFLPIFAALLFLTSSSHAAAGPLAPKQDFFAIRVYQLKNPQQEERVDKFLKEALLPALHRQGMGKVGVFKPLGNDTAAIRRIYVLMSFHSLEQFAQLPAGLEKDTRYLADGKDYLDAMHDDPPYVRIETILLQAFPGMTHLEAPTTLTTSAAQRVYELRSYEGPTEKYFSNKVQMFNKGDEIGLFKRLGFNAVFYASVLSGAHMPNLMYMTSFDDMESREAHWKAFGADPYWRQLVAQPQYQHNVSHVDIIFLHPAAYSDL